MEKMYKVCDGIRKYLESNKLWCDVYPYEGLPVVSVEINWGDWKHEHLRCKWLMEQIGAKFVATKETEENGSDCYSAIHYFTVDDLVSMA